MPRQKQSGSPLQRWLLFIVMVPLLGYWAVSHHARLVEWDEWRGGWEAEGLDFLVDQGADDIPANSEALLFGARFFGERSLPPQYEQAHSLLRSAILKAPWDSALWLYVSRFRLFEGQWDRAREALAYSGTLNPNHTGRRLLAIEMWDLLGDNERAVEVGLQIARTGPSARNAVAPELIWVGVDPVDVFDMLHDEDFTSDETVDLLFALGPIDADSLGRILDRIPESAYQEPAFRDRMIRRLSDPLVYDRAVFLWKADYPSLDEIGGLTQGGPILASNLNLARSPLLEGFHYGWQPFPTTLDARVEWTRTETDGRLRLTFLPNPKTNPFGWQFYRQPIPPHDEPILLSVPVFMAEPSVSSLQLSAQYGSRRINGPRRPARSGHLDRFELVLPPGEDARLLTLSLIRHYVEPAVGLRREEVLLIDGIDFGRPASGEESP